MKNHIKAIIIAILFVLAVFLQASAQKLIMDYSISEKHFVDTIKIKMWKGAIIIPVEIDGETKNMIFPFIIKIIWHSFSLHSHFCGPILLGKTKTICFMLGGPMC